MIVAAVPVKRLTHGKSRLESVLSPSEREDLVRHLVSRTVHALQVSGAFDRVALISDERALASELGVDVIPDGPSLNDALSGGIEWALAVGARSLVITVADLPNIRPSHIELLLHARTEGPGVVLARTQDGGTAALVLTPPNVISPSFGPQSGARHAEAAVRSGISLREVSDEDLSVDLDTVADFERFKDTLWDTVPPHTSA